LPLGGLAVGDCREALVGVVGVGFQYFAVWAVVSSSATPVCSATELEASGQVREYGKADVWPTPLTR
jgi:hypothetical protein